MAILHNEIQVDITTPYGASEFFFNKAGKAGAKFLQDWLSLFPFSLWEPSLLFFFKWTWRIELGV